MSEKRSISLGTFDLFKGLGIIGIVFCHVLLRYPLEFTKVTGILFMPFQVVRSMVMQTFFLVSGYGFRKRSTDKYLKGQFVTLMKAYYLVSLITVVLHWLAHYLSFHYLPGANAETLRVMVGMFFGFPVTAEYFGYKIFSCGPAWYLITLAMSSLFLTVIMNHVEEKKVPYAVLGAVLLGYGISRFVALPFCFNQSLICLGYLYLGYVMKKLKIYNRDFSKWLLFVLFMIFAVPHFLAFDGHIDILNSEYPYGLFSVFSSVLAAGVLVYLIGRMKPLKGRVASFFSFVGSISLYAYCVHSVEDVAIPWYRFVDKFPASTPVSMIAQTLIRVSLVAGLAYVIKNYKRLLKS